MNDDTARSYGGRMRQEGLGAGVSVGVPLRMGTHHTITVLSRESGGEYGEGCSVKHPSRMRALEVEARVGDIIHQRVTSPASAGVLERFGVVLGEERIDWGSDADWVVDFGPMGDVTRRGLRSPSASYSPQRGRIVGSSGEEVVGGAVPGVSTTSGD